MMTVMTLIRKVTVVRITMIKKLRITIPKQNKTKKQKKQQPNNNSNKGNNNSHLSDYQEKQ